MDRITNNDVDSRRKECIRFEDNERSSAVLEELEDSDEMT
jgi:hypothetical protein